MHPRMRLKLISLNLWMQVDWEGRKRDIIAFLKEQDADIVAFQEVHDDHALNRPGHHTVKQLNEELGYPHMHFAPTMDLNRIDGTPLLPPRIEGLALLSKHPLSAETVALTRHDTDKFKRAILTARVLTDPPVDVWVVHYSPHEVHSLKQYEETLALSRQREVTPVILGDFNIFQPAIVEERAAEHLCSSAEHEYISFPGREWTIDYILIPSSYSFEEFACPDLELSDHRPIVATIHVG